MSKRRWRRRAGWALLALVLLIGVDYQSYPRLAGRSGRSGNRGENGLWLRYWWYFGQRSDDDIRALVRHLSRQQIRYAYFHVRHITRDGRLRYRYPEKARRLVARMHREAPSIQIIAWVFAGNRATRVPGLNEVELGDERVRRRMVAEARWLVTECGFDGVQWDYEICSDNERPFHRLLRETRAALPPGKSLSIASPMWAPIPGWLGWSEAFFAEVAAECDQIAVMAYDSGVYLPRAYVRLVREQVVRVSRAVARGNPRCRVLIGVPTYAKGGPSHHAYAENLRLALKGVRDGVADPRSERSTFAGVAPFAEYTTQPEEWEVFREWWLEER